MFPGLQQIVSVVVEHKSQLQPGLGLGARRGLQAQHCQQTAHSLLYFGGGLMEEGLHHSKKARDGRATEAVRERERSGHYHKYTILYPCHHPCMGIESNFEVVVVVVGGGRGGGHLHK